MSRGRLIDALVHDLRPVRPATPIPLTFFGWTLIAWTTVGALVLWTGPLREGAIAAFWTSPRYAAEFVIAAIAGATSAWVALDLGVPNESSPVRKFGAVAILLLLWISILGYGVFDPTLDTGMLGKRPYCRIETILFALPALGVGLLAVSRRALYAHTCSGALLGVAAGAIPAALMQLACLYDPLHALTHHLAPVAIVALLGASAAHRLIDRF